MPTIARNSKRIPGLKERLTVCYRFDQAGQYKGAPCDPAHAWDRLLNPERRRSRLSSDGDTYTITVHGSLWYELREPDPARGEQPWGTGPEPEGLVRVDCRRRVRATAGERMGQRGIVTGPAVLIVSVRYLPVLWGDGTESGYWPEYLATVDSDPVCAGEGCHCRYDGTAWYAVDSEITAHAHDLPAWALEEHEFDQGRLEEAAEARSRQAGNFWPETRLTGLAAEADARLPQPGLAAASAAAEVRGAPFGGDYWRVWSVVLAAGRADVHGGGSEEWASRNAAERTSKAPEGVVYVALPFPEAPDISAMRGLAVPPAAGYTGELPADLAAEGAPVPTLASIGAVLDAAGIGPRYEPRQRIDLAVAIALQRGWVRGREDLLAEQAKAEERPGPVTSERYAGQLMADWAAKGRVTHEFDGDEGEKFCRRCAGGPAGIQHTMPAGIRLD